MKTVNQPSELIEKERMRMQINEQIEEFLRRGGSIDVVTSAGATGKSGLGTAWNDPEDFVSVTD